MKYFAKADIRKCYESISREKLMTFLTKHVKNDLLLWLINDLLYRFEKGLSIGSYLSQYLCNLYMSQLYHFISEKLFKLKNHKNGVAEKIRLICHTLFYMDDIFIIGRGKKYLHKSIKMIRKYIKEELGLEIKDDWFVSKIESNVKTWIDNDGFHIETINKDRHKHKMDKFVDMMGFRIYRNNKISIRRRNFKRIRRVYMRMHKMMKTHRRFDLCRARKCISYFGYIKHTNNCCILKKYHAYRIVNICRKVVSDYEKLIRQKTEPCYNM